jgi:chemotaxis protein CheD
MLDETLCDIFMNDKVDGLEYGNYYLYPGALYCALEPHRVTTVLGSCISLCLWDSNLRIGGINHYLSPFWNGDGLPSPRYGNIAIENLLERMYAMGCGKKNLQAKIFGGASLLVFNHPLTNVGERNIQVAREMLDAEGIPIASYDVGGYNGRKIIFDTHTGKVMLKRLRPISKNGTTVGQGNEPKRSP